MNNSGLFGYCSAPKRRSAARGFTLMELLIALFVFSVCAGLAYRSIDVLSKSKALVTEDIQELSDLQRLVTFLEKDLRWSAKITYEPAGVQEGNDSELALFSLGGAGDDQCREISPCEIRYALQKGMVFRSRDGMTEDLFFNDKDDDKVLVGKNIESFVVEGLGATEDIAPGVLVSIRHQQFGEVRHAFFRGGAETKVMASAENLDLDTLDVAPLMPTTIGGVAETDDGKEPVPIVLDEADTVADGW